MEDEKEFTITCKMKPRWIPHFLKMLKYMQSLGNSGSSREVCFYADGDGDFRPKFSWDSKICDDPTLITIKPKREHNGNVLFDAG